MPASSKSQQRLMGMVYAYKDGKLKLDSLAPSLAKKIKDIADGSKKKTGDRRTKTKGMSMKDAKHFASTKHKGLPEKVEENLSSSLKADYISYLLDSTNYDRDYLESLSDEDLSDLYGEVNELLEVSPIGPDAYLEEWLPDYEENEKLITKFDSFINEAKKNKKPKGQKLSFEDWWKKSYEKKSDYWVAKSEIKQGYQPNELTHYYERKLKSKHNKYLKKRKK